MAMYTSLYDEENLEKIITKVRDIYARPHIKAQIAAEAAASASTAGVPSATPFKQMTDQYMYLQGNGDNKQKPFKPYVTPQGRGRGRGRGGRGRGRGRGRGAAQGVDSKELAEDSLPSGETGNREAVQEEEDKSMIKALM